MRPDRRAGVRRHPDAGRRDRARPSAPAPRDTRRRAPRARRSTRPARRARPRARRWPAVACLRTLTYPQRGADLPVLDPRPRAERRARAGSRWRLEAHPRHLRRPPGTGRRRSRWCPRGAPDAAGSGHARRDRHRPGSGRRATDRVRGRRDSAPGAAQPCRRAPAPRQAKDPSVHRSPGLGRVFVRSAQRACNWFVPARGRAAQ